MQTEIQQWIDNVIKPEEYEKYMDGGKDFIQDAQIEQTLGKNTSPDESRIREIMAKSLELKRLDLDETAALLNCTDEGLWNEMYDLGLKIKQKVYGRRIVVFAPLYVSNYCVNGCVYCGYREANQDIHRQQLTMDELANEIRALEDSGHKRLIMVYGEHPRSDVHYIAETLKVAYGTKSGNGEIRRANINAAPLSIADYKILRDVGIGTYQVFQETYHHATYAQMHTKNIKANYPWRLYSLHRAMEAGVDDVGLGVLFGLYDWKFEVMGLLAHTIDLEKRFNNVGPHTISFPRIQPAVNTPFTASSPHLVGDEQFKKLATVLRLSVPYTGMIITARESAASRNDVINVGCTQIDAGSNIGIGTYAEKEIEHDKQQFILGDNRSLDEAIRDLTKMGYITSFCTAGYRCGRTGSMFMDIARNGKVHNLCMPNAILTFNEYLHDYAAPETIEAGKVLIQKELEALPTPELKTKVSELLSRIDKGERDLYL